MQAKGIEMVYGRWLIEGAPRILLIDTKTGYRWLDEWKGDLWNTAGIPSPPGDDETNEAVVFGYLVAWFLGEVSRGNSNDYKGALLMNSSAVCLPREKEGNYCPFSRMAGWCSSSIDQKAENRCHYNLYYTCHALGEISLRRICGFLQQLAVF